MKPPKAVSSSGLLIVTSRTHAANAGLNGQAQSTLAGSAEPPCWIATQNLGLPLTWVALGAGRFVWLSRG